MPPLRPIGFVQLVHAAVFLAGFYLSVYWMDADNFSSPWPVIFLIVWPGVLLAIAAIIGCLLNRTSVTLFKIFNGFLIGELTLVIYVCLAVYLALWPVWLALLMAFTAFIVLGVVGILSYEIFMRKVLRRKGKIFLPTAKVKPKEFPRLKRFSEAIERKLGKVLKPLPELGFLNNKWIDPGKKRWFETEPSVAEATERFVELRYDLYYEHMHHH